MFILPGIEASLQRQLTMHVASQEVDGGGGFESLGRLGARD